MWIELLNTILLGLLLYRSLKPAPMIATVVEPIPPPANTTDPELLKVSNMVMAACTRLDQIHDEAVASNANASPVKEVIDILSAEQCDAIQDQLINIDRRIQILATAQSNKSPWGKPRTMINEHSFKPKVSA